jgi:hypothetical protein
VGITPVAGDSIVVEPLVPANRWPWFAVDNLSYHGKTLTIFWDKTGQKYRRGRGLFIYEGDELLAHSEKLQLLQQKIDSF